MKANLLIILLFFIFSCKSSKIYVDKIGDSTNILSQITFQFVQNGSIKTPNFEEEKTVEKEIERQLKLRGLVKVTEKADLLILTKWFDKKSVLPMEFSATVNNKTERTIQYVAFPANTFLIQLYSSKLNQVVWQGFATNFSRNTTSKEKGNAARIILEQLATPFSIESSLSKR